MPDVGQVLDAARAFADGLGIHLHTPSVPTPVLVVGGGLAVVVGLFVVTVLALEIATPVRAVQESWPLARMWALTNWKTTLVLAVIVALFAVVGAPAFVALAVAVAVGAYVVAVDRSMLPDPNARPLTDAEITAEEEAEGEDE